MFDHSDFGALLICYVNRTHNSWNHFCCNFFPGSGNISGRLTGLADLEMSCHTWTLGGDATVRDDCVNNSDKTTRLFHNFCSLFLWWNALLWYYHAVSLNNGILLILLCFLTLFAGKADILSATGWTGMNTAMTAVQYDSSANHLKFVP